MSRTGPAEETSQMQSAFGAGRRANRANAASSGASQCAGAQHLRAEKPLYLWIQLMRLTRAIKSILTIGGNKEKDDIRKLFQYIRAKRLASMDWVAIYQQYCHLIVVEGRISVNDTLDIWPEYFFHPLQPCYCYYKLRQGKY